MPHFPLDWQRKMSILDKKLTLPADIAKGHHLFVPSEFSSPYFQFPLGNPIVHDKKKVLNNPSELCLQMLWERKENVSLLIHWRTLKLSGQQRMSRDLSIQVVGCYLVLTVNRSPKAVEVTSINRISVRHFHKKKSNLRSYAGGRCNNSVQTNL